MILYLTVSAFKADNSSLESLLLLGDPIHVHPQRSVRARFAIVSVGRHNLFGRPAPATIARLQQNGARVYRTDEVGAVTIRSNGNVTSVESFLRARSGQFAASLHAHQVGAQQRGSRTAFAVK
jgi:5-enolpyruvylshikimate-3-phosphate synthase